MADKSRLADMKIGSRERFEFSQLLVNTIQEYAIFLLDPTGHIATWNPGAQKLKGYKANEIIGKHFSVFYPQKDKDAGKPEWELEVATSEGMSKMKAGVSKRMDQHFGQMWSLRHCVMMRGNS